MTTLRRNRRKARSGFKPVFRRLLTLLLLHPGVGTRTDDPTIRRMTALPYRYVILYEASKSEIIIHAVRHASRDPSGMPGARA